MKAADNIMKKLFFTFALLLALALYVSAEGSITITYQPCSAYGALGDELTFSVAAYGDDLKYAWYWRLEDAATGEILEEQELGAECSTTIVLTSQMNDPTKKSYVYCLLSDSYGNIATTLYAEAAVKRYEPQEIELVYQPSESIECKLGDEVMISVAVSIPEAELGTLAYQWYRSGDTAVKLDGETRPYLKVSADNIGISSYYCTVTNERDGIIDTSLHKSEVRVTVKAVDMKFSDIDKSAWYYENVNTACSLGLLKGKSTTTFCPSDSMTVAEAVTLACQIHLKKSESGIKLENGSDVWYSTYMDYALKNGIIENDLSASANEAITRRQFAMIYANLISDESSSNVSISDVPSDANGAQSIYKLYNAKILTGYEDNTFRPELLISRSEAATIAVRIINY